MKLNTKIIITLLVGLIATAATQQSHAAAENTGQSLIAAVESGNIEEVRILIAAGANPNARNNKGSTALHIAVNSGNTAITQALIDARADLNKQNRFGCTALHIAVNHGSTAITQALIDAHADLNKQDRLGHTALHRAVNSGSATSIKITNAGITHYTRCDESRTEIIQKLIKTDINLNAKTKDGKTALNITCEQRCWPMVELILNATRLQENRKTYANLTHYNNHIKLPDDILAEITEFVTDTPSSFIIDMLRNKKTELVTPTPQWLHEKLDHYYATYRNWKRTQPGYERFDEKYKHRRNVRNDGGGPA